MKHLVYTSAIHKSILFTLLALVLLGGCKTPKRAAKKPVENKNTSFLFEQLKKNEFRYMGLSAKIDVNLKMNSKDQSFTVHLRHKTDSIIWMSIRLFKAEMARIIITPDSVKLLDRWNDQYFLGNFDLINEKLNVDADFELLEALIAGNHYPMFREGKYKSKVADDMHLLSNKSYRKIKKINRKEDWNKIRLTAHNIWLNPETYKIEKMEILEMKSNKKLESIYSDFKETNGGLFPYKATFNITSKQKGQMNLEYLKHSTEKELRFPFRIPEKFVEMKLESDTTNTDTIDKK